MPVEVIGREIEKQADVRAKRFDQLELKAAQLDDGHGVPSCVGDAGNQRRADVAGENRRKGRGLQNVFDQRCRRRFSVRARDADQRSLQETVGQLDFAPNCDAVGLGRQQKRKIRRYAGTWDNEVLRQEGFLVVATEFEGHARAAKLRDVLADLRFGPRFGGGHDRTASRTEQRGRDTCPR